MHGFAVLFDNWKVSSSEIWNKMTVKKLQKLRFCKNCNFIGERSEAAIHGNSGINLKENTRGGVLI